MENIAHTAGAVEAAQVVVAVVVAGGGLSWGHLALVNVWGRARQTGSRKGEGISLRPGLGLRGPQPPSCPERSLLWNEGGSCPAKCQRPNKVTVAFL